MLWDYSAVQRSAGPEVDGTTTAELLLQEWNGKYRLDRMAHPCEMRMLEDCLGASMLYWAIMFLIIALVAAFLGFAGVATAAAGIAKILFYVFLIMFLVSLIVGVSRRGTRV
jgi:uncharacterized membrane protein YtjA (UPF0391 family)